MTRDAISELANGDRHLLIAPAGHGKTHAIAHAVARSPKPQLVLTHTHAGVRSLRRHLAQARVASGDVHVDTIAGFARRWATAFPQIADWDPGHPVPAWEGLYEAATRVIRRPQLSASIQRSHRGVFVDEYQDCTLDQHDLVLHLAEVLPTRVVGDPLQGIFAFGGSQTVDFDQHVLTSFEPLEPLDTPWRWASTNPGLGDDLRRVREELVRGEVPNFATYASIELVDGSHPAAAVSACQRIAERSGSAAAIRPQPRQAHALAKKLQGLYVSMEEGEGRDVIAAAERLMSTDGPARAAALLDTLETCTTRVIPALRNARVSLNAGKLPVVPRGRNEGAVRVLNTLASEPGFQTLPAALSQLCTYPDAIVYRPEIPTDLAEAARLHWATPDLSLVEAAVAVRDRGRRDGRRLPKRIVSRTLLVKGLEFDHVLVLDTTQHDTKNLYVALTRGARSVTVVQS